jgi:hypothetical protein
MREMRRSLAQPKASGSSSIALGRGSYPVLQVLTVGQSFVAITIQNGLRAT